MFSQTGQLKALTAEALLTASAALFILGLPLALVPETPLAARAALAPSAISLPELA